MENKEEIKEEEIRFLKFPENIRKRPGMYLGDLGNANIALREIIDNSCDEISSGYGKNILISTNLGGYNFVADDGRGIPISFSKDKPDTIQAYLSISEIHAGSKFETTTEGSRTGLNGIGSSAVNATSVIYVLLSRITESNYNKSIPEVKTLWESCGPRSKRDLFYIVVCEKGLKVFEGAMKLKDIEKKLGLASGTIPEGLSTIVLFKPDPEIYESTKTEVPEINLQYFLLIQEKFYGKKINVLVDGVKLNSTFKPYKHEFVKTIIPKDTTKNKRVDFYMTFQIDPTLSDKSLIGSINGLESKGFHINVAENCFKLALKDTYKMKHDYLTNGLQFCVIILAQEVSFNSQTKETLKSISGVKQADFDPIIKEIEKCFKKDPDYWQGYVDNLQTYADSMKSLSAKDKAQKMIDSNSGSSAYKNRVTLSDKFSDATGSDRWNCELFLTEGQSTLSSLKSGRKDAKHIAIGALRGKVLNTTEKTAEEMLTNVELYSIFSLIGLGLDCNNVTIGAKTPEEAYERIKEKSRFGKIIICTDSDSDGSQISNLLLYSFSKYSRFLIDFGMIYLLRSPLYSQNGKYYYPDDPRQVGTDFPVGLDPKKPFHRFKGLGSLNAEDIHDIFFNPSTRRLIQITPEGIDYSMGLMENIDNRKQLLYDAGILSNPYNFIDI